MFETGTLKQVQSAFLSDHRITGVELLGSLSKKARTIGERSFPYKLGKTKNVDTRDSDGEEIIMSETFNLPVLESMYAGRPSLCIVIPGTGPSFTSPKTIMAVEISR